MTDPSVEVEAAHFSVPLCLSPCVTQGDKQTGEGQPVDQATKLVILRARLSGRRLESRPRPAVCRHRQTGPAAEPSGNRGLSGPCFIRPCPHPMATILRSGRIRQHRPEPRKRCHSWPAPDPATGEETWPDPPSPPSPRLASGRRRDGKDSASLFRCDSAATLQAAGDVRGFEIHRDDHRRRIGLIGNPVAPRLDP